MNQSVDQYTQIEATLALANVEMNVSEVHGIVVGAVCNHLKSGVSPDLLKLVEPQAEAGDGRYSQLSEMLYEVYRQTSSQFIEGAEGYGLVIPEDDESLEFRAESVAAWSKGFLLGLLYNNAFSIDQLPESGPEIVKDILQISEAGAGADSEQEEDWALAELEEYLKVGSQLVFEFIYSERATDAPANTH